MTAARNALGCVISAFGAVPVSKRIGMHSCTMLGSRLIARVWL